MRTRKWRTGNDWRRSMTHGMDYMQLRAETEAGSAGDQRLAPGIGIIKESKRSVVASAAAAALAFPRKDASFPRTFRREVLLRIRNFTCPMHTLAWLASCVLSAVVCARAVPHTHT